MTGWFSRVPAYRLAALRIAVAAATLLYHIPHFERMVHRYLQCSYHTPVVAWLPELPQWAGPALLPLRRILGIGLLFGVFPRLSAGLLAASGFYILLLDLRFYSSNAYFHLLLLSLLACSSDRLGLMKLFRGEGAQATCPAWPERLIRIQVSIIFFYSALDKLVSPFWGAGGEMLRELFLRHPSVLQGWLSQAAGMISAGIIALEFFVAAALIYPPLRRAGVAAVLFFAIALEIFVAPELFPWDLMACMILFMR